MSFRGFCSDAILSKSIVVQFGSGVCVSMWSHVLISGLIVMIRAYSIRGGGEVGLCICSGRDVGIW